ncbi:MAG TPA: hypothetical protein VJP77_03695, partial [Planctomycetota bacterium]|nr:hypothetical protein [Planctomycetota bacterium]
WQPELGEPEDDDWPLTRAVRTTFQFRGVLDTYSHAHGAGTPILPVFSVPDPSPANPQQGWPGRFDFVFLLDGTPSDPGFPAEVHRAVRPEDYREHAWLEQPPLALSAAAGPTEAVDETRFDTNRIYVALAEQAGVPLAPGAAVAGSTDIREHARISKFPSGELPREVEQVAIGGAFDSPALVPDALLDEVVLGDTEFLLGTPVGEAGKGAALVLADDLGPDVFELRVRPATLRLPGNDVGLPTGVLESLPEDGGLLRIGNELLVYSARDPASGTVTVAEAGRGLLGTEPRFHRAGESVVWLSHTPVTVLDSALDVGDSDLFVADLDEFPEQGTVLVGEELVHHTARREGALVMPRRSNLAGAMDAGGPGLFRGRYGSNELAHPAGTAVIWFPFRYWDRWEPAADAPELHYFGFHLAQPDAYVRRAFFAVEETALGGARTGVLQRASPDVP